MRLGRRREGADRGGFGRSRTAPSSPPAVSACAPAPAPAPALVLNVGFGGGATVQPELPAAAAMDCAVFSSMGLASGGGASSPPPVPEGCSAVAASGSVGGGEPAATLEEFMWEYRRFWLLVNMDVMWNSFPMSCNRTHTPVRDTRWAARESVPHAS